MPRIDTLTLIAVGVVAYAVANVAHESGGHGLACIAVGAHLKALNAVYCDCDRGGVSDGAGRLISAAGSFANVVVGALALVLLRARRGKQRAAVDLFLWALVAVDVLQPTGYLLFSGVGKVGDWADVIDGLPNAGVLRIVEAVAGAGLYYAAARFTASLLAPFCNAAPDRVATARKIAMTSYIAGGLLYAAAGALNPLGGTVFLISALAAGFGGTSALAWCTAMLKDKKLAPTASEPLVVDRSPAWIAAAVVVAALFVVVLGRTVAIG